MTLRELTRRLAWELALVAILGGIVAALFAVASLILHGSVRW